MDTNSIYGNDVVVNAGGTLKFSAFHAHTQDIILAGGSLTSSGTGKYNGDDFQLNGNVTVTGTTASTIQLDNGFSLTNAPTLNVENVTGDAAADLTVSGIGSIHNPDTGTSAFTKTGAGTLVLDNPNTYTGPTTVSAGMLRVNGSLGASAVTVQSTAMLGGTGTLGGATTIQAGGTLAPGINGTGHLTINNTLDLAGIAQMEIGKNGGVLSNDKISGISTLTYGGSLVVTHLGPDTLAAGDTFPLFAANSYSGNFAGNPTLPQLESGLQWDTSKLTVDGTISVKLAPSAVVSLSASDIGAVGVAGSTSYSNGDYTVNGGGADIWGSVDEFHFASTTMSGDGEIRARVPSQANTHAWAKAGVMIRNGTAANAAHVTMAITPGNGFALMYRTTAGGSSVRIAGPALNASPNNWVRLTRCGNLITGYVSADGVNWGAPVGQVTISMESTVNVGLAATSHNDAVTSAVTFDNVAVTPYPLPWLTMDLGSTGVAGRAEFFKNIHTVTGAGTLGGAADGFRYLYQTMTGDGVIVARINTLQNAGANARIGLMVRDTLASNAANVFVGCDGAGTYCWSNRAASGEGTTTTNGSVGISGNMWVKLERNATTHTFTLWTRADGENWTLLGTTNVTMGNNCYVGLMVSSGSGATTSTSALSNVSVTP